MSLTAFMGSNRHFEALANDQCSSLKNRKLFFESEEAPACLSTYSSEGSPRSRGAHIAIYDKANLPNERTAFCTRPSRPYHAPSTTSRSAADASFASRQFPHRLTQKTRYSNKIACSILLLSTMLATAVVAAVLVLVWSARQPGRWLVLRCCLRLRTMIMNLGDDLGTIQLPTLDSHVVWCPCLRLILRSMNFIVFVAVRLETGDPQPQLQHVRLVSSRLNSYCHTCAC